MTKGEMATTVMPLYIDTAKMFGQLAIGALGVSIFFKEKILGEVGKKSINLTLVGCWLLFLVSVGASALYQYVAVKWIIYLLASPEQENEAASFFTGIGYLLQPAFVYATMLITFFLGATLLVLACTQQLLPKKGRPKAGAFISRYRKPGEETRVTEAG